MLSIIPHIPLQLHTLTNNGSSQAEKVYKFVLLAKYFTLVTKKHTIINRGNFSLQVVLHMNHKNTQYETRGFYLVSKSS
jgi:hypothetical protein